MTNPPLLAIIGGSGLYAMPGLTEIEEHDLTTPFGKPSDPVVVGTLDGKRVAFLARHGRGHRFTPTEVNYRANIYALKMLGVRRIVSVSACGSLKEEFAPGHIVIPDQLFDFTKSRERSFFGPALSGAEGGLVVHVGVAEPFCPQLSPLTYEAVKATGATVHPGGSFITIEGPRFSTKAESLAYRAWGMHLIGMTASPEAFLAREAEMCYACMAHVTDYDVWHHSEEPVTVEMIIHTLNANTEYAQKAILNLVNRLAGEQAPCPCENALADAIITARDKIPAETKERLKLLTGKYLG